jgi:cobalt-zinc-cadmium efflux system membrane fusion protein
MKTRDERTSILLVAVALAALVPACQRVAEPTVAEHDEHEDPADQVHLTAEAIATHGIVVARAERRAVERRLRVPARIVFNADAMAHVGTPVRGRVASLSARLGAEVKRGDELLVVESPELGEAQSDLLLKQSAAVNAEPQVDLAASAVERARRLYESAQGISLADLQRREAELRVAQAALATAKAARIAAENRLHLLGMSQAAVERILKSGEIEPSFHVVAPIDGTVVEREVTLGHLVDPTRESLLVLADLTHLWVLADVPEGRLGEVAIGAAASVVVASAADHSHEGRVTSIAPQIDPTTRSAQVRIEVVERHAEIRPGVFAEVDLVLAPKLDDVPLPLVVPDEAVQTFEGKRCVFVPVAGAAGTFRPVPVEPGERLDRAVVITAGLDEGQEFVAKGAFLLKAELGKSSAAHEH